MFKAVCAGALTLAMIGSAAWASETIVRDQPRPIVQKDQDRVPVKSPERAAVKKDQVTVDAVVTRIKQTLRLTAQQEPYWPPVRAALREVLREQSQATLHEILKRPGSQRHPVHLHPGAFNRIASAALPLIQTLDERQKQDALRLARSIGLESVAWAF